MDGCACCTMFSNVAMVRHYASGGFNSRSAIARVDGSRDSQPLRPWSQALEASLHPRGGVLWGKLRTLQRAAAIIAVATTGAGAANGIAGRDTQGASKDDAQGASKDDGRIALCESLIRERSLDKACALLNELAALSGEPPSSILSEEAVRELASACSEKLLKGGVWRYLVLLEGLVARVPGLDARQLVDRKAWAVLRSACLSLVHKGRPQQCVSVFARLQGLGLAVKPMVKPCEVIACCLQHASVELALRYVDLLPRQSGNYHAVIEECGRRGDLEGARSALRSLRDRGIRSDTYTYRAIMDACARCGDPSAALAIFEEMEGDGIAPNAYVYNSLLNAHVGDMDQVWALYARMQKEGVPADVTTQNILLKSCSQQENADMAMLLYHNWTARAEEGGPPIHISTYSTVIEILGQAKRWEQALEVKAEMEVAGLRPDVVTWTALIGSCTNAGLVEQAFRLFADMREAGVAPSVYTYNRLINACVDAGQEDRALRLFQEMKERCEGGAGTGQLTAGQTHPCQPNSVTYNTLMKACRGSPSRVRDLMKDMCDAGIKPCETTWSTLIDAHGAAGDLAGAVAAFEEMQGTGLKGDVITFTALMKVCVRAGNIDRAFDTYELMKASGVKPNLVTFNTLLRRQMRCRELHEVQRTLALYEEMRAMGYAPNDDLLRSLIDEWAEGAIDGSQVAHVRSGGSGGSSGGQVAECGVPALPPIPVFSRLLFEKVAVQAGPGDERELLTVDLHGLSKTEARTAVLSVLRILRERHLAGSPSPVENDLVIITGAGRHSEVPGVSVIREAVIHVLQQELGLPVLVPAFLVPASMAASPPGGEDEGNEEEEERRTSTEDSDGKRHNDDVAREGPGEGGARDPEISVVLSWLKPKTGGRIKIGDGGAFSIAPRKPMLVPAVGEVGSNLKNPGRLIVKREALNAWLAKRRKLSSGVVRSASS